MKKYKKKCYNCGNVDRFTIKEMRNLHFCQRCYKQHDTMCDVFANSVLELEKQNKRYREAIKECLERMNEGGAGTRSFVYEKLSEALKSDNNE